MGNKDLFQRKPKPPRTRQQRQVQRKKAHDEGVFKAFLKEVCRVGTIRAGAKAAGVSRATVRLWMEDPDLRHRFLDALADYKDLVQERLDKRTRGKKGNGASLRFLVKGELPEKFGDARHRAPDTSKDVDARWEELKRAIREDPDGSGPST
jgi:molybdenum-dependent DNA-binding transcriptional regulator ModE